MKVIVTGASGFLGREVVKKIKASYDWQVIGLAFSRAGPGLEKVDITDVHQVEALLRREKPDFVVHAAAERFPDKVEKDYDRAQSLNVNASGNIARIAKEVGGRILYISTDYVFDGNSPPYTVADVPKPLNKYGLTKLQGERAVLEADPDSLVLRVPVLYGPVEALWESAVTCLLPLVQNSQAPVTVSNYEKRYPASTCDIADIVCQIIEKAARNVGESKEGALKGVFQWSGLEQYTKYEMCLQIAEMFSLSSSHISPANEAAPGSALRPHDSKMDNSRLEQLGISCHTPFPKALKECLQPWVEAGTEASC